MSKLRSMDERSEERGSESKKARVRQPSPVLDEGTIRRRPYWPFTFSLQDNRWYVNKGKTRSSRKNTDDQQDDALF